LISDLSIKLARSVLEASPTAKDEVECAVILESLGFGEEFSKRNGYLNTFDMAREVYEASLYLKASSMHLKEGLTVRTAKAGFKEVFVGGLIYNTTWLVFLFFILAFGVAPFAARLLPLEVATMLSLSVIISFVVTGGLQQFAAWKVIFYTLHRNYPLAKYVFKSTMVLGFFLLAVSGVVVSALTLWFQILPVNLALELILSTLLIGAFRLWMIPILALRCYKGMLVVVAAMVVALSIGYGFFSFSYQQIRVVQTITVLTGVATAFLVSRRLMDFSRFISEVEDVPPFYSRPVPPTKVKPPRLSVMMFRGWDNLVYGSFYFVFLFADRILAALAGGNLQYNAQYHMGADLALLLIIVASLVRFSRIHPFTRLAEMESRRLHLHSSGKMSRFLSAYYTRMMLLTGAITAVAASILLVFSPQIIALVGGSAHSVDVFRIAVLANIFFSLFATNAVYTMTMRRLGVPSLILVIGTILHLGLSSILLAGLSTIGIAYSYLASSVALFVLSTVYVIRLNKKGAHVLYSAF